LPEYHIYEPKNGHGLAHDPLNSIVVPRPIGWVSTLDGEGRRNLAPYSFFNLYSYKPPIVGFSSNGWKDSVRNIEATGEFVVNFSSEELLDMVNASSAPFEHGDDEARLLDIHMEDSSTVAPPRVAESPASIECRLERIVEVGSAYVVFGAVSAITVLDDVLVDGHPEMEHLRPVSRLGGDEWGRPPEVFHLTRPATPDDVL
jgi:flavin reductase (DIM6/NTAB) family NADH-FMN oxidoreductase RutF